MRKKKVSSQKKETVANSVKVNKKEITTEDMNRPPPTLVGEVLRLVLKVAIIALAFILLFTFMFGGMRYSDNSMDPAVKEGDIILYYRLDKRYLAGDSIIVEYEGKKEIRRVVAIVGDTVDITDEGLLINGALQQEHDIYMETMPYVDGIEYPVTLQEGEVFLLGDNRTEAVDSRLYGPVKLEDTFGKVMTVVRRRDI